MKNTLSKLSLASVATILLQVMRSNLRYTLTMKFLAYITLTLVLGTMFISLFHMSMGMDMSGGMTDCPFMSHEEVICPMSLVDHIGAWQSVFLAVVPALTLLLAATSIAVLVAAIAPNLLKKSRHIPAPSCRLFRARTYTFSYRPYQELFSSGILNPKLF